MYKGCVSPYNIIWLRCGKSSQENLQFTQRCMSLSCQSEDTEELWYVRGCLQTELYNLLAPHRFLFSPETLLSSSFFTSFSFFPWCWPSPLGPFYHDWLQIYGHFLPAPAWDCWASTTYISGAGLPGPQSQSLRFSTACHKGRHHLLLLWPCLCLLFSKVSKPQLKTAPDLGCCQHQVLLGPGASVTTKEQPGDFSIGGN